MKKKKKILTISIKTKILYLTVTCVTVVYSVWCRASQHVLLKTRSLSSHQSLPRRHIGFSGGGDAPHFAVLRSVIVRDSQKKGAVCNPCRFRNRAITVPLVSLCQTCAFFGRRGQRCCAVRFCVSGKLHSIIIMQ